MDGFTAEEMARLKHWANTTPEDITNGIQKALETPEAQAAYERILKPWLNTMEQAMDNAFAEMDDPATYGKAIAEKLEPEFQKLKDRITRLEAAIFRHGALR